MTTQDTGSSLDSLIYSEELTELAAQTDGALYFDRDETAPKLWAVWIDLGAGGEDIIGAGDSPSEALEDARATVRGWEASS